jgi:hypothetical protein
MSICSTFVGAAYNTSVTDNGNNKSNTTNAPVQIYNNHTRLGTGTVPFPSGNILPTVKNRIEVWIYKKLFFPISYPYSPQKRELSFEDANCIF